MGLTCGGSIAQRTRIYDRARRGLNCMVPSMVLCCKGCPGKRSEEGETDVVDAMSDGVRGAGGLAESHDPNHPAGQLLYYVGRPRP